MQVVGTRISRLLRTAHAELSRLCATSVARQTDGGHVGVLSKFIMPNSAAQQLQDVALSWRTDTPTFGRNHFLSCFNPWSHNTAGRQKKTQSQLHAKRLSTHISFWGKNRSVWSSATLARRVAKVLKKFGRHQAWDIIFAQSWMHVALDYSMQAPRVA